ATLPALETASRCFIIARRQLREPAGGTTMRASFSRMSSRYWLPGIAALALGAASAPAAAETITVTHWGSSFYGAPYAVAMAKGFFKPHGVDVTGILTSAGGGTSVRNTLAGELPYGEVALSAAVLAINSGQPLKIISGGVDTVADILWITQPDSPLKSIKD